MLNPNRTRQMIVAAVLAVTALGLFMGNLIPTAHAAGIVVNSADDKTTNNDDGFCTLREAIINANNNAQTWTDCAGGSGADTITFAPGLHSIILTDDLPDITDDLTINGIKGLFLQVINGNGHRVFSVSNGVIFNLHNVSVTNGRADLGAAILNYGEGWVSGCRFSNNTATNSGGAINSAGVLTITNSNFTGNNASSAGGAIVFGGKATVSGSNFISNTASYGGALANSGGAVVVTGSTFITNTATNSGGAIAIWKGGVTPTLTITGSIFTSNHADNLGGGIWNSQGIVMVTTGVFTANTATSDGGAINNSSGKFMVGGSTFANNGANGNGGAIYASEVFTVTNSTFTNNSAGTNNGGAIYQGWSLSLLVDHSTFSGNGGLNALYRLNNNFTLRHSIVANSAGQNCSEIITDGGYNLQYGGTVANSCGATIETANPQLGPLADNGGKTPTMSLPEGSPALNRIPGAGGCGVGITVDQRGVARPQPSDGLCDIGAYEEEEEEEEEENKVFMPIVLK